jgi:2-C-methyl-D-erythritol 4-phosphate cytidylyltransferase
MLPQISKVIIINLNEKDYLQDHISYFMNNVIILIKNGHNFQNNETNIIKMKDQIQIKIRKNIY